MAACASCLTMGGTAGGRPARPPWIRGMERLDPPVEHLRQAGHRRHVGDRQAGLAQRARGATGRDQLEAGLQRARARSTRPALSDTDRSARRGTGMRRRAGSWSIRTRPPSTRQRPRAAGRRRAAAGGARRRGCAPEGSRSSDAWTTTGAWGTIGPPSSLASTRWTVTPVTVTPAASASSMAWARETPAAATDGR